MGSAVAKVKVEDMGVKAKETVYDGDVGPFNKFQEFNTPQEFEPSQKEDVKKRNTESQILGSIKKTLFVLGSAIIVLVAVRNSLVLQVQNIWGASGSFWQAQWDRILEYFDHDEFKVFFYGTMIVQYCMYWGVGIFYIFMDLTLRPDFFRRYKIQPGTNEPVDIWKLLKVIGVVHFNQLVVTPLSIITSYYVTTWRGYDTSPQLPTFQWVLLELVACILIEEIGFYYSHRLFHHRLLYKHFHKLHHDWQSPISVTAIYAHPLEHYISNLGPVILGPMILGSHMSTAWLWIQLALLSTLNAHCGYHFPFFPSPEAHDYHHLKFNQCYGVLGVLDMLHGTDARFRTTKAFARHVMTLSLVPPRTTHPDEPKSVKKSQE